MISQSIPSRFIPSDYQQCTKTVMDNIGDPGIIFDADGVSNYYHDYFKNLPKEIADKDFASRQMNKFLRDIRAVSKNRPYDCIIGLSGGVDSTYIALKAKEYGLRPLAVHFDNGWNSELAVKNIENIINILGFDLDTHVFDWSQFRDLQLAHFKANVIDIEGITDVAIHSVLVSMALEYKIPFVLTGYNYVTESILPSAWVFKDYRNIQDIHNRFGTIPVNLFPYYSNWKQKLLYLASDIRFVRLLDYLDYDKALAKKEINKKLNWLDYGGKHYESVFTRFYQGYILPQKFGVDKRKAHLSNLICSGQLSKEEALIELGKAIYPPDLLAVDMDFTLKKLGFTETEFEAYISAPAVSHSDYATEAGYQEKGFLYKIKHWLKP